MTTRELDYWFRHLDSAEVSTIFPSLYEEVTASADPGANINTFLREAKEEWKGMTREEKQRLYWLIEEK